MLVNPYSSCKGREIYSLISAVKNKEELVLCLKLSFMFLLFTKNLRNFKYICLSYFVH